MSRLDQVPDPATAKGAEGSGRSAAGGATRRHQGWPVDAAREIVLNDNEEPSI
jgi:hypothetical protein